MRRCDFERAQALLAQAAGKMKPPQATGHVGAVESALATEQRFQQPIATAVCQHCARMNQKGMENGVCEICRKCPVHHPEDVTLLTEFVCEPCARKHGEKILCISCRRLPVKGSSQCKACHQDFYAPGPKGPDEFLPNPAPLNPSPEQSHSSLIVPGVGAAWQYGESFAGR